MSIAVPGAFLSPDRLFRSKGSLAESRKTTFENRSSDIEVLVNNLHNAGFALVRGVWIRETCDIG